MKKLLIWLFISLLSLSGVYAGESRSYLLDTYGTQWEGYVNLIDNFIEKNKNKREKLETLQSKIVTILWSYNFKNTTKDKKTKAVIEFLLEAVNDELIFWNLENLQDGVYRQDRIDESGYILYQVQGGKMNGSYHTYDAEDNIVSIVTYKDNIVEWLANSFYQWGENIKSIATFSNGLLHWEAKEYYEDGAIKTENNYINNILDGEQNHYLDDWTLIKKENLKMWVRHGKYQEWYNNGQLKVEDNSVDGKFVWKATQWYMNGQKKFESQYNENGNLHWPATSWYSNGEINIQDNWDNWVLNGKRTIYPTSSSRDGTVQIYDYGILKKSYHTSCTLATCGPGDY